MSRSSAMGLAAYSVEGSFGEVSSSVGTRLAILDRVSLGGFKQPKIPSEHVTANRNQVLPGNNGVKRCEFRVRMYLTGHGSTCAATITLNDLETLLGIGLGRGSADVAAASSSGGMLATSGGSSTSLNVASATGFAAGSIGRAGALGDGRGGGQPFVVGSHAGSVIALLTELPNALNAGDQIYSPAVINVPELAANNGITSTRWLLQTANGQILANGCYPKQVEIVCDNSALPHVAITFGGAWWEYVNQTYPAALTQQTFAAAPVAGGSCFFNTVGTNTRNLLSVRAFRLTYGMAVAEDVGPGGLRAEQDIIGCRRLRDTLSVQVTLDSDPASSHTLSTYFDGGPYHLLYGWSAVDGKAGGVYLPYLVPDGDRPTQEDEGGVNRSTMMLKAGTGGTSTSELTASMLRVFSG